MLPLLQTGEMNELHGTVTFAWTDKRILWRVSLVQAYPTVPALRNPLLLGFVECLLEIPTIVTTIGSKILNTYALKPMAGG